MPQVWGKVKIPAGKKIAVNLGCDFDAQSLWICLNRTSPAYMSRGEFGAEVGMPRLMRLFDKYKVRSTFCIPGPYHRHLARALPRSRSRGTRDWASRLRP